MFATSASPNAPIQIVGVPMVGYALREKLKSSLLFQGIVLYMEGGYGYNYSPQLFGILVHVKGL